MPTIDIASNQISNLTPEEVPAVIDNTLASMVDQINGAPLIYPVNAGGIQPVGLKDGDLTVGFAAGNQPQIGIFDGSTAQIISSSQTQQDMGFAGRISDTGAPSTAHFSANQWGFYTDTSGPTNYLAFNYQGSIVKTTLT